MATSNTNPFNVSVFNEVRPTYVGPPVEELAAARDYLTGVAKENRLAQNLLDESFSDSIANMQGDDEGIAMIMEHRNNFSNALSDITNEKNLAYAGPAIQKYVNAFAKDYRIKGRQKLVDEFNTYQDGVRNNENISASTKKAILDNVNLNKFAQRDDANGIYQLGEIPQPYERIDVNEELLKVAKTQLGFPDITSWDNISFRDANGNLTKTFDPKGTVAIIDENNVIIKEVTADRLKLGFESAIKNNDALRGYLIQESLVGDYYKDPTKNPIDRMGEIYNNPELLSRVAREASEGLANALQYNQELVDNNLSNLNLYNRSTKTNTNVPQEALGYKTPALKMSNTLDDKESLVTQIDASKANTEGILADALYPDGNVNGSIILSVANGVRNGDPNAYETLRKHTSPQKFLQTKAQVEDAIHREELLNQLRDEIIHSNFTDYSYGVLHSGTSEIQAALDKIAHDEWRDIDKEIANTPGATYLEKLRNSDVYQDAQQGDNKWNVNYRALAEAFYNAEGNKLLDRYDKALKKDLKGRAAVINSGVTSAVPVLFNENTKQFKTELNDRLLNRSFLKGVNVYKEGLEKTFSEKEIDNMDLDNATIDVTTLPVLDGNKYLWVVNAESKGNADDPGTPTKFYVAVDEDTGITSGAFDLIKQTPQFRAKAFINQVSNYRLNEFNSSLVPNVTIYNKQGKLSAVDGDGKTITSTELEDYVTNQILNSDINNLLDTPLQKAVDAYIENMEGEAITLDAVEQAKLLGQLGIGDPKEAERILQYISMKYQ